MSANFLAGQPGATVLRAAASVIMILVMTSVHHAYGAAIYDTPWRLHVVFYAVPAALAVAALFYLGWRAREGVGGAAASWLGLALAVGFPIMMIGLFEGGYNHLVKIVLYYTAPAALVERLFPNPPYELPNDFFFEATGVAQLALAILAAVRLGRLFRRPNPTGASQPARG